jgi:predicted permease
MSDWESGLDQEIRFHLEQAVRYYVAGGMSEEDARAKARREFGSIDLAKEEVRDTLPLRWLHDLAQDLRYAVRSHAKSRGVAIVAVLTLALGIGAATCIFSLVHAVLLKSLPYPDSRNLVYVWSPNSNFAAIPKELGPSNATYYDWQRLSRSFDDLAMFIQYHPKFSADGGKSQEAVDGVTVTGNFFHAFGVAPQLGRAIEPEDDQPGHDNVVVISHNLWKNKFQSNPEVIGKSVRIDKQLYQVVGVMPASFGYPAAWETPGSVRSGDQNIAVWTPLGLSPKDRANEGFSGYGDGVVVGRVRQGVSVQQAQTEMSAIMTQLVAKRTDLGKGSGALVGSLIETAFGDVPKEMLLLLGIVGMVLLIMCGNVANLLLARYSGRTHEMGIRAAMGASPSRLIRLMIAEGLLLSFSGGAIGTALAFGGVKTLVRLAPADLPRITQTSIDARVLLFAVGVSLMTGLLCGLLPALSASRVGVTPLLYSGGVRGAMASGRTRRFLIASEVALSLVLVTGAGLLIRSYVRLAKEGAGFKGEVLSTRVFLPDETPSKKTTEIFRQILAELEARPEISSAAINSNLPLSGSGAAQTLQIEGYAPKEPLSVHHRGISPRYFEAMGIRVLEGRIFEDRDYGSKVSYVVASEGFSRRFFPGQSAVGKRIRYDLGGPWEEIIGVVADVKNYELEEPPLREIYRPMDRTAQPGMFLVVRSRVPAEQLSPLIRQIVLSAQPEANIEAFQTMEDRVWLAGAERRFDTSLISSLALLALLLAVVGLFGLVAHSVRMRTKELGLRMALGGSRGNVFAMVLGQGFRLLAAGAVIGIVGSWAVTRLLGNLLYGVGATDPLTFVGAPLVLVAAGLAACVLPGLRASQIDPAVALRDE